MKQVLAPVQGGPEENLKKRTCGNPLGRPLGARTRLSDAFLKDMVADWEAHGAATIETFRNERPNEYVKLVAAILPRHFNIKVNELDELSDEELARQFDALVAAIAAAGDGCGAGAGETTAAETAGALPALR